MTDSNNRDKTNMKQQNNTPAGSNQNPTTNPQQKQPWTGGKPTAGTTGGQQQPKQPWNPDQNKDKTKK